MLDRDLGGRPVHERVGSAACRSSHPLPRCIPSARARPRRRAAARPRLGASQPARGRHATSSGSGSRSIRSETSWTTLSSTSRSAIRWPEGEGITIYPRASEVEPCLTAASAGLDAAYAKSRPGTRPLPAEARRTLSRRGRAVHKRRLGEQRRCRPRAPEGRRRRRSRLLRRREPAAEPLRDVPARPGEHPVRLHQAVTPPLRAANLQRPRNDSLTAGRQGFDSNIRPAERTRSTMRANGHDSVPIPQPRHDRGLTPIMGVGVWLNRDAGMRR